MTSGHGPRKRLRAADLADEIRVLVGEDRFDDALSLLQVEVPGLPASLADDVTLLGPRLRAIEVDERRGTATREQLLVRRQEVAEAMLRIVRELCPPPEPADSVPLRPLEPAELKARSRYLKDLRAHVENLLHESIHNARFLDLGIADTPAATHLPWRYKNPASAVEFGSIADAFRAYDRRLLLLGAPGSGKTTTLLHLALDLIAEAERDAAAPIPLIVNLSSFRPQPPAPSFLSRLWPSSEKVPEVDRSFEHWLADELAARPSVSRSQARQWVREGRMAALLDGLDEVSDERRAEVAVVLNTTYLREHPESVVLVCSRVDEYRQLQDRKTTRLQFPGAITLQPLSRPQIAAYLDAARASGLREALGRDAVLDEMAQTPLILSMMTLAYGGLSADAIPRFKLVADQRHHLMESFIFRMIQRKERRDKGIPFDDDPDKDVRPADCCYRPERTTRYLSWLAVRLSVRMRTSFPAHGLYTLLGDGAASELEVVEAWVASLARASILFLAVLVVAAPIVPREPASLLAAFAIALSAAGVQVLVHRIQRRLEFREGEGVQIYVDRLKVRKWVEGAQIVAVALLAVPAFGAVSISLAAVLPGGLSPAPAGRLALCLLLALDAGVELCGPRRAGHLLFLGGTLAGAMLGAAATCGHWIGWPPDRVLAAAVVSGQMAVLIMLLVREANGRLRILASVVIVCGLLGGILTLQAIAVRWMGTLRWALASGLVAAALLAAVGAAPKRVTRLGLLMIFSALGGCLAGKEGSVLGAAAFGSTWLLFDSLKSALQARLPDPAVGRSREPESRNSAVAAVRLHRWLTGIEERVLDSVDGRAERWISTPIVTRLLALSGRLPWTWRSFLRYCGHSLLLKPFSGEVEFAHRRLRDHFALRDLIPYLQVSEVHARTDVIAALGLQGAAGIEPLAELIAEGRIEERAAAVKALGRIAAPEVTPHIERALSDPAAEVREAAVASLGHRPASEALDLLSKVMRDPLFEVRKGAINVGLAVGKHENVLFALLFDGRHAAELLRYVASGVDALLAAALKRADLPPAAGQALKELLADSAASVRKAACEWMGWNKELADVKGLLALLQGDPDEVVRAAAAEALGRVPDPLAVEPLVRALKTDSAAVRKAAARGLSSLPDARAAEPLLDALRDADPLVRSAAAETLGDWHAASAVESVLPLLGDPQVSVRRVAARVLGRLGDQRAVESLIRSLRAPDPVVRELAAQALGKIADPSALGALVEALKDGTSRVREVAVEAIGTVADRRAVEPLVRRLKDKDPDVRRAAVGALGDLRDPRGVEPLLSALKDQRKDVRRAAVEALGWIGDGRSFEPLVLALEDPEADIRGAAAEALGRLGDPRAVEPLLRRVDDHAFPARLTAVSVVTLLRKGQGHLLREERGDAPRSSRHWSPRLSTMKSLGRRDLLIEALQDPRAEVCRAAAELLGELRESNAAEPLRAALRSSGPTVRSAVAVALGRIGEPRSMDALSEALQDSEPAVREAAARALKEIGYSQGAGTGLLEPPTSPDADTPR